MSVRFPFVLSTVLALFTPQACGATVTDPMPDGCQLSQHRGAPEIAHAGSKPAFPPLQLDIRTPVAPAPFASGGRNYLVYELHLQNFTYEPLTLRGIEVIAGAATETRPIAAFDEKQLRHVLRPVGIEVDDPREIGVGLATVAYLCVAFDKGAAIPTELRHRVLVGQATADGPLVRVSRSAPPVLGRPLLGTGWNPRNGPHAGSHHRMGLLVIDGLATIGRRYAIDWRKSKDGKPFAGDARDVRSYYAYGEKVLSVAEGTVVVARDGFPDNVPKTEAGFAPALPLTMENVAGNQIVLDIGGGNFASYSHLQAGSVRVKAGDRVRRGQWLGRVGNSGDARWPHLHFQVSTDANVLAGEGVPFVHDRFSIKTADDWSTRTAELPWGDEAVVDFGEESGGQ